MKETEMIAEFKKPIPQYFAETPLSSCKDCPNYKQFKNIGWACNLMDPGAYKECYLNVDEEARIGISRKDFEKSKQAPEHESDQGASGGVLRDGGT